MCLKYSLIFNVLSTLAIAVDSSPRRIYPIKNQQMLMKIHYPKKCYSCLKNQHNYIDAVNIKLSDNKNQFDHFIPNNINNNNNKKIKSVERFRKKIHPDTVHSLYDIKFIQKGKNIEPMNNINTNSYSLRPNKSLNIKDDIRIKDKKKSKLKNNTSSRTIPPKSSHNYSFDAEKKRQENQLKSNTSLTIPSNHKLANEEDNKYSYIRDHPPRNEGEETEVKKNVDKSNEKQPKSINTLEVSPNGERIEFQVQGHDGPQTYIFGYDTGEGKNRQYRLEERTKDGIVQGHYGYYDARGKLRTIKYKASPSNGYEEKHHESPT